MSKLTIYNSVKEIEIFFNVQIINNSTELESLISQYSSSTDYIYRGVHDGSWKIFASSQRDYIEHDLSNKFKNYDTYLKSIYENSKNTHDNLLEKLYDGTRQIFTYNGNNTVNIPYNSLWAFSFLQHYKTPSPFIDFTGDFYAALFFATDNSYISDNSFLLSDYVQINLFLKKNLNPDHSLLIDSIKQTEQDNPGNIDIALNIFINHFDYFNKKSKIFYVDRNIKTKKIFPSNSSPNIEIDFNIFNLNIIAQNGLFFINYEEDKCLEEQWSGLSMDKLNKVLIHKSLLNDIRKILINQAGKDFKDFYYPQEELLSKEIYKNSFIYSS
jgi:hypothetical protein